MKLNNLYNVELDAFDRAILRGAVGGRGVKLAAEHVGYSTQGLTNLLTGTNAGSVKHVAALIEAYLEQYFDQVTPERRNQWQSVLAADALDPMTLQQYMSAVKLLGGTAAYRALPFIIETLQGETN